MDTLEIKPGSMPRRDPKWLAEAWAAAAARARRRALKLTNNGAPHQGKRECARRLKKAAK